MLSGKRTFDHWSRRRRRRRCWLNRRWRDGRSSGGFLWMHEIGLHSRRKDRRRRRLIEMKVRYGRFVSTRQKRRARPSGNSIRVRSSCILKVIRAMKMTLESIEQDLLSLDCFCALSSIRWVDRSKHWQVSNLDTMEEQRLHQEVVPCSTDRFEDFLKRILFQFRSSPSPRKQTVNELRIRHDRGRCKMLRCIDNGIVHGGLIRCHCWLRRISTRISQSSIFLAVDSDRLRG